MYKENRVLLFSRFNCHTLSLGYMRMVTLVCVFPLWWTIPENKLSKILRKYTHRILWFIQALILHCMTYKSLLTRPNLVYNIPMESSLCLVSRDINHLIIAIKLSELLPFWQHRTDLLGNLQISRLRQSFVISSFRTTLCTLYQWKATDV